LCETFRHHQRGEFPGIQAKGRKEMGTIQKS
jgi:hypothetical protein